MTLTKIKVAAAVAGAVIITGAGAMPLVSHASNFFTVPVAQHTITTLVQTNTSPAATAPSSNAFEAEVSDKIKVELLGVTSYPAGEDTWFAPNGDAIECPRPAVVNRENQMHLRPEPQQAMLIKLEKPADTCVRMEIENSTTVSNARIDDDNEQLLLAAFNLNGSPQEFSFRIGFSDMPWKTVAASEKPTEETTFDAAGVGAVTFHPVEPADQGCKVVAEHAAIRSPHQIVVTDEAGKEYKSENINIQSDGQNATVTCTFSIEPEKVKQVHLQTREFNKFVDVSNVSLEKGHATKPEMKVVEAKDK